MCRPCLLLLLAFLAAAATGQTDSDLRYQPYVGQPGKDVIWVPTPPALVEKMLDMAKVTPQDFVIDLGSGDGRNIIAAARRGARGLGVEYDSDLVWLSQQKTTVEGLGHLARFVRGDMYETDISQATVLVLFLLPENLERLRPKFEKLRPGSRIVTNGYAIPGWTAKEVRSAEADCGSWCEAYLYMVPAPD